MTHHEPSGVPSEVLLARAIATVARSADPDAALATLLASATAAVGADHAAVAMWDSVRGSLALAASVGYAPEEVSALEAEVASNPDHPIARTAHGQTAILGSESAAVGGTMSTQATLPLRVASGGMDEPLGALAVSRAGSWHVGEADAGLLAALADLIALAIDRARLTAAAQERSDWQERMAHTDALTGLANARTLSRVLELEVARAGRQGTELSVAVFDVDNLRAVNDGAGPAAGDDILREVAAVLAESVRLVDTVARTGGDEFLVVAPGAAGMTVARRVLDALAGRSAEGRSPISVSAGVARFPADGTTPDELIGAASAALLTAKSSGPGTLAAAGAA
ncbi:MAG: GGDEF domain-containing protein [Chloroflexi bacterium]|nr:GGDEF domain-containing protein [Chloroflexota bacterium]